MDATQLRDMLAQALAKGMQVMVEERNTTQSGFRFAELTGSMDTIKTTLQFLQSVEVDPPCPPRGRAKAKAKKEEAK